MECISATDQSDCPGRLLPCAQGPEPFGASAAQREVRQRNTFAPVRAVPREVDGILGRQHILVVSCV